MLKKIDKYDFCRVVRDAAQIDAQSGVLIRPWLFFAGLDDAHKAQQKQRDTRSQF
jgi:hypothetical protein